MNRISLAEKFSLIHEHWRPKVVAELNGQELKLVKFAGVFPWHRHEQEDELFVVWHGQMTIEFREQFSRLCDQPTSDVERHPSSGGVEVFLVPDKTGARRFVVHTGVSSY
jgi:hypothetical protein